MKLLEIQSSIRVEKSISRSLTQKFILMWKKFNVEVEWKQRDVGLHPPAHPTEAWVTANYTPVEDRTLEMNAVLSDSEQLIEEVLWADRLLLSVPMYNFSVPSAFKAYLDNIVRVDRTFIFNSVNFTFRGLATNKKALIITPSAGDFKPGTPMKNLNFCDTYLQSILGFIGIDDVTVVAIPNQFMPDEIRQNSIEQARMKLTHLAKVW